VTVNHLSPLARIGADSMSARIHKHILRIFFHMDGICPSACGMMKTKKSKSSMKNNKTAKARPVCFDGRFIGYAEKIFQNPAHSGAIPGRAGRCRRSSVNRIEKKIKKCQNCQNPCNSGPNPIFQICLSILPFWRFVAPLQLCVFALNSVDHIGRHGQIAWSEDIEICSDAAYEEITGKVLVGVPNA
jgi:hypothetical protein